MRRGTQRSNSPCDTDARCLRPSGGRSYINGMLRSVSPRKDAKSGVRSSSGYSSCSRATILMRRFDTSTLKPLSDVALVFYPTTDDRCAPRSGAVFARRARVVLGSAADAERARVEAFTRHRHPKASGRLIKQRMTRSPSWARDVTFSGWSRADGAASRPQRPVVARVPQDDSEDPCFRESRSARR